MPSQIVPLVSTRAAPADQRRKVRNIQIARVLHPFAQKGIPDRAEQNEQEKQHVGFGLDEFCGGHCGNKTR